MIDPCKLNPCEYESYVGAMSWAETQCWCCTATRAVLVGFLAGISVGLVLAEAFLAAAWFTLIAAPIAAFALFIARRIWKDEEVGGDGNKS